jgi:hypothetical protein
MATLGWRGLLVRVILVAMPTFRSRSKLDQFWPRLRSRRNRRVILARTGEDPRRPMSSKTIYQPRYAKSWALVIGINEYQIASPLGFARQDAEAFAEVLTTRHSFSPESVTVLLDGDATKEKILSEFHRFQKEDVSPDDRIAVFFAGHGLTRTGNRGEVGFLLPVDGDPDDPATLVRWDDLTRNADLIAASTCFL